MKRRASAWWTVLALAAVLPIGGCAPGLAWFVAQFAQEKVQALYKPPARKTVLVFVDDMLNPVSTPAIKGELTERLNAQLTQHKLAAVTVPHTKLMELMSAGRDFDRLSVAEVGRKLGAELVLYVHIDKFSLRDEEQGSLWRGELRATIRWVDVQTGRLWPDDRPEGHALPPVETPVVDSTSAATGQELTRQLAELAADRIAKCFYDHTVPVTPPPREEGL